MKSDLPFSSEFSPNTIELQKVLSLIEQFQGDRTSVEKEFKIAFFDKNKTDEKNKAKLAMNLWLSLKAYQIIDTKTQFTQFGLQLSLNKNDTVAVYSLLAKQFC